MVGVGGLSLPSKLLSAGGGREKDAQTGGGSPGLRRGRNATGALPSLPKNRLGAWSGQTREAEVERGTGWRRGALGADETERDGKHVPTDMCLGLTLPCPCSGPSWVTAWGWWGVRCMEVSVGARAPHGPAGHHPTDTHGTALLWAAGLCPAGGQGELQRPLAGCRKRLLPSSALHIPPLSPSPRRQLQALLRWRSGKRGKRVTQAATNVLSAAKPGPPLLRLRRPGDAPAPACSTAAHASQLTAAPDRHRAASARPPAPLRRSRAGCKHPNGFSKCKGPHMPAQRRRHVLPHNAVVLMCFRSALFRLRPWLLLCLAQPWAPLPAAAWDPASFLTLVGGQG